MAKKIILLAIAFIFLGLIGLLARKYQEKAKKIAIIKEQVQTIPDLILKTIGGEVISLTNYAEGSPFLIVYFNSTCEICRIELNAINERISEFKKVKVLLASSQELSELEDIYKDFPFVSELNFQVAWDDEMRLSEFLGIKSVPTNFCYGENADLISIHQGPVKMDILLGKLLNGKEEKP
ncbi:peroxiredoxin family protein [Pleomorphovibrio marinus]|uniref:peroxiredoxin family protein n=1 Tax=Pleomorphovibrio marinus TaxID=2164132 RepID=UPI000E0A242A|nr:redoxin domain-containing protein [Pleomorphovibrio marinus]